MRAMSDPDGDGAGSPPRDRPDGAAPDEPSPRATLLGFAVPPPPATAATSAPEPPAALAALPSAASPAPTSPSPASAVPTAASGSHLAPVSYPPSGPHPAPASSLPSGPHPAPATPDPSASASGFSLGDVVGDVIDKVPVKPLWAHFKQAAKRAFRLRIDPSEVLPQERETLLAASPPISDPNLQAFLAWRRSVLFLVVVCLVPLTVIGLYEAIAFHDYAWEIQLVKVAPAVAEAIFLAICWSQTRRWASWRRQRRILFYGWALFMFTPFVAFAVPLREVFENIARETSTKEAWLAMGVSGAYKKTLQPFVFAMLAMLQLAPKVISLMPGLIRSSLVIKLLFPGSSTPGWLIAAAAPLYALFVYAILVVPYQFTGDGWFMVGILCVVLGQAALAWTGFQLARPLSEADALAAIKRVRMYYLMLMIMAAAFIVIALGGLTKLLDLRWTSVVTTVLKFETNVLILTMIGADLVITNLDKARVYTAGRDDIEEQAEAKIAAFVGLGGSSPEPPPR